MAFQDLTKPSEVKDYLKKVLTRPGKGGKDKSFLYHYTKIQSAAPILRTGFIWLGSTVHMNDYLEGEFIQSESNSNRMFFTCFSKIEENLAMYKMYAPEPNGVMLSISYSMAQRIVDELQIKDGKKQVYIVRDNRLTNEMVEAEVYWSAVAYKDLHGDTLNAESVSNSNIRRPLSVSELAGFVKLYGWEYEKEVRLCAITNRDLAENEKVAIKLPDDLEVKLITGPGFDRNENRHDYSELKRMGVEIKASEYDALVDLGSSQVTTSAASQTPNNADIAKHIIDIKAKIEGAIVDKSWVKTHEDHMKLLSDRPSQFKCNNLILKDPTVDNPDIGNGLIKVEPHDFSDDGIIVCVPRGDMRKKIEVQGRGVIEADVFSEVLFRDILEVQEHGSINWPQPTLFCNFRKGSPFHRDVYYDAATVIPIEESKITNYNPIKVPKLEVKLLGSGGHMDHMLFTITNASNIIISALEATGVAAKFIEEKNGQVSATPKIDKTVLMPGEETKVHVENDGFFSSGKSWTNFTAIWYLQCEDENGNKFSYKISQKIEKLPDKRSDRWDVEGRVKL